MNEKTALAILDRPLPKVMRAADPCSTYKQIKPILGAVAFLVGLIPAWGKQAAAAVNAAISILDKVCP